MLDLLIINAHRQHDVTTPMERDWLGIHILAAYMEANAHPTRAFSGYAHEIPALLEEQMAFGVKVVGFSCDYENQREVTAFCRMVKQQWKVPVIVGGPQAMALGEDFLRDSGADVCVRGEGELALLSLMHHFVNDTGELEDIKGISFLHGGKLCRTADQPPIRNLDILPFPDPKLVCGAPFRKNAASFLTARGCPFRCSFCYEGGNTRGVRWRSVDNVMAEVRQTLLGQPGLRYILFTDDTFTISVQRVRQFTTALSQLRTERDFGWFAEAHPATLLRHPEMVKRMVEAGLVTLQIGVESGHADVLRAYNKKTTPAMIEETVDLCLASGLPHMVANIIVGGALETEETIATSHAFGLRLLERGKGMLELHAINFWPLPGTAMTTHPDRFGMEILDPQSLTSTTDYPVVRCGALTPERLSHLRAEMEKALTDKVYALAAQLPPERVEMHFALARRYDFRTSWYFTLYALARCRRYAALRESGAARRMDDVPNGDIEQWHPQRTCEPIARDDTFFAGDLLIEACYFPVLVACAGRMTTKEAANHCKMDMETFLAKARYLEERMALLFCRF